MKALYRALVVLLVITLTAVAVTTIIKSNQALERSRYTAAQADEFLRRYERR